jgi:hypothetical protein
LLLSPWYRDLLGAPGWGEVAWCLTAQGLLFSLDSVLGPLLLREAARAGTPAQAHSVRARFLRIFCVIALAVALIVQGVLWQLGDVAWKHAAQWASVQAMFQFANLALIGFWHGRRQQPRAYARSACFLAAKHGLALALLVGWRATGTVYFAAFALVAAIEFGLNWRATRVDAGPAQASEAAPRWPAPFVLAALAAWPMAHVDRLWLGKVLDAASFGLYFLLGTLLLSMLHLQLPILRAFLPGVVADATPGAGLARLRLASMLLRVAPAVALAIVAGPFLRLWLDAASASPEAVATLRGMMLAAVLFALAAPGVARLWRDARYGAIAAISVAGLALQAAMLAAFAGTLGMRAGALAWVACGFAQWTGARVLAARA